MSSTSIFTQQLTCPERLFQLFKWLYLILNCPKSLISSKMGPTMYIKLLNNLPTSTSILTRICEHPYMYGIYTIRRPCTLNQSNSSIQTNTNNSSQPTQSHLVQFNSKQLALHIQGGIEQYINLPKTTCFVKKTISH